MTTQINAGDKMKTGNFSDKMKSVKAACDKAPAGPKKDAALKCCQAADKAHTAKHDDEAFRELDKATKALA